MVSGSSGVDVGHGEASPQGGGGGCGWRLDALSRQGPGPRQLRAQILLGSSGEGLTSMGTPWESPPPIPERRWGRGRRELGGKAGAQQVPTSTSQRPRPPPPTPAHPLPPWPAPGPLVCRRPHGNLRAQTQRQGHFLCTAPAAEWPAQPAPLSEHLSAQGSLTLTGPHGTDPNPSAGLGRAWGRERTVTSRHVPPVTLAGLWNWLWGVQGREERKFRVYK